MEFDSKYDKLMHEVTHGDLEDKVEELVPRMEEVLEDEGMGTMDDMMADLRDYLEAKDKLEQYLDENGVMKIPLETVFSWFSSSVKKRREGEF